MNTKILTAAILVSSLLSSCSIFSPRHNSVTGSSATKVTTVSEKKTPSTTAADIPAEIGGEWTIVSVFGKTVPPTDDMPYVTFHVPTGKFYASNGCNIINGDYTVSAKGAVSFSNVLSTMKSCPATDYEYPISQALSGEEVLNASISRLGQESFITFTNSHGKDVMTAKKHNMEFLNGNWQITTVNGKTVDNDEATVFIDIPELKVHGNTGCNFFNGDIYINPEKANAVDFSNIGSTRMACPDYQQESAILLAFEETSTAISGGDGKVILLNSAGKEVMTLKSVPVQTE